MVFQLDQVEISVCKATVMPLLNDPIWFQVNEELVLLEIDMFSLFYHLLYLISPMLFHSKKTGAVISTIYKLPISLVESRKISNFGFVLAWRIA
jgi:hypothetical protein